MGAVDVVSLLNAKLQSSVPLFGVDVLLVDTFGEFACYGSSQLCNNMLLTILNARLRV